MSVDSIQAEIFEAHVRRLITGPEPEWYRRVKARQSVELSDHQVALVAEVKRRTASTDDSASAQEDTQP